MKKLNVILLFVLFSLNGYSQELPITVQSILEKVEKADFTKLSIKDSPVSTELAERLGVEWTRVYTVVFNQSWNMENAHRLKKIVMEFMPFEPKINPKYDTMQWTGSKIDIIIADVASNERIQLRFNIK